MLGPKIAYRIQEQNNAMGLWPFSSSDDSSNDQANGLQLLQSYYDVASTVSSLPSFNEWVSVLESKVPSFAAMLGELVRLNYASTSLAQAQARMADLASKSQGQANVSELTSAAGGGGDTVNWTAAASEVVGETVSDVGSGILSTGQNLVTGLSATSNLLKYVPYIAIGLAAVYLYTMSKNFKVPGL